MASRIVTPLAMFEYFNWIERTDLSVWIREDSLWAFPIVLILHTVGLVFLVGANVALDARVLGVARGVPLPAMLPFFRAMWLGFWVNAASGVLLLAAYPTKALTNPVFYVKLALIAVGLVHARWIHRQILDNPAFGETPSPAAVKVLSAAALACWLAAVTAGRLLAYTHTYLLAFERR
ncbi:MAG: hypothetical protein EXQ53_12325 [Acidobacteria bacterium]|nr:hypothetical protein [Acidobacteriota bacterium]